MNSQLKIVLVAVAGWLIVSGLWDAGLLPGADKGAPVTWREIVVVTLAGLAAVGALIMGIRAIRQKNGRGDSSD